LLLAALCLTNLLAIRLELFRGRLANTYLAYEDLRAKESVREDSGDYAARGLKSLDEGDLEKASALFKQGVERRPFLLRYLLGECRLSDTRWMTGGQSLREWVNEVALKYTSGEVAPSEQGVRIREAMERELLDYSGTGNCWSNYYLYYRHVQIWLDNLFLHKARLAAYLYCTNSLPLYLPLHL
jgi:hypothetical protein